MISRTLRNLAYFAAGVFLAASFLLGTTQVHAAPARATLTAAVHKMHDNFGHYCSVVMISPERALTAAHCLSMVDPIITIKDYEYTITETTANKNDRDLAVVSIPGAPCPCAVISTTPLIEGDWVAAVGYPGDVLVTVTYGEFQGQATYQRDEREYLQITAPSGPGSSGGGVFNAEGELVGIVGMGIPGIISLAVEITFNDLTH